MIIDFLRDLDWSLEYYLINTMQNDDTSGLYQYLAQKKNPGNPPAVTPVSHPVLIYQKQIVSKLTSDGFLMKEGILYKVTGNGYYFFHDTKNTYMGKPYQQQHAKKNIGA